ncbi:IS110 family transposase [Rhodococcus qingshengii]|uniref:IS110 family transposase n=1 Tax=Rhodococcus qingshengii TaxID=334542 RepID=UPI001F148ABE|nr:IS110 family transposase [Rhodococcus qingshengii]ULD38992.1 IS110 family transposase [Rhodococcus qingshengii]
MLVSEKLWAGIDVGKEHHHCVVIDAAGERVLSRRIGNDEAALNTLIDDVTDLAGNGGELLWAVDLNRGGAALVIGLLAARNHPVAYLTGLMMHRAAAGYRGEGKTDARDAFVIADQARVRRDLGLLRPGDDIAVDLRILTGRRLDVVFDRTRQINRLRALLLEVCPALERALTLTNTGPLMLLTRYQSPPQIRRAGAARIEAWLRKQHVRGAAALAQKAVTAAAQQNISLPGETVAAQMIARLATAVIALDTEIAELDSEIEARFRRHRSAEIIVSMPGFGPTLGAQFLAATGGDMTAFSSVDQLAGFAGLAPQPRDSGRIHANLRRPKRYHRGLLRVMYLSAQISISRSAQSDVFYHRKRAEGKTHKQAVLALARRRLNVLWAMLRDHTTYHDSPPSTGVVAA